MAAVAAIALILVPALIQTDVISALIELIELKGPATVGRIFNIKNTDLKFNVLGDQTDEEILEYGQQLLADEGVITSARGFIIQGKPYWTVARVYQAFGKELESGRRSREPACVLTKACEQFILNDWDDYLARIEDGSLKPVGSELVELDGHSFRMRIWELEHPEFGVIKYYEGEVEKEELPVKDD